jgi:hypothetical protein
MILMAQAIPSAERLPCIESVPIGWVASLTTVAPDRATFALGSTPGSDDPFSVQIGQLPIVPLVEVTVTPTCPASPQAAGAESLPFEGGCATYSSSLPAWTPTVPSFEEGGGLSWIDRSAIVAALGDDDVLKLCGPDVDCLDG